MTPVVRSAKQAAEKEFLKQADRDTEYFEQLAAAKRKLEALKDELYQKHEGDEEKVRREFLQRCKEDATIGDAAFRCAFHEQMGKLRPSTRQ